MIKLLDVVGLMLCSVAALFALLATALPFWQTENRTFLGVQVRAHYGLWRYCTNVASNTDICGSIMDAVSDDDVKSALYATRAMVVMGLLCTCAAIFPLVALFFCLDGHQIKRLTSLGLSATGGLFLMIGMAVFDGKVAQDHSDLSAAFVMDILGWLCSWAAAGTLAFVYRSIANVD